MNKVVGFDNRAYVWNLSGNLVNAGDIRPKSSYHLQCRALLKEMFPTSPVCEEVFLPGSGNLRLDFYLPHQRMAIEVHGEQHYKLKSMFHSNKAAFLSAKKRDVDKIKWCENNNIRLVALKYSDSIDEWKRQIYVCQGKS